MAHTDIETINGYVVRRLHSPDGKKDFGYLTLPVGDESGNPDLVKKHATIDEAFERVNPPKFIQVDKWNGHVICKVVRGRRTLHYITYPTGEPTNCAQYDSLAAARQSLGKSDLEQDMSPKKRSAPKLSYPQNQKGYKR